MMDFSAAHSGFVAVAYMLSAICLVGLCIYIVRRDRQIARDLLAHKSPSRP